jgi:hypothetical protein
MPADGITLSDGEVTTERAPTRRHARLPLLGADVVASRRKVIVRPPEFSFIVITDAAAVRQAAAPTQLG